MRSTTAKAAIAACLIVKDGVDTIERAIASVRPHVAEVCVLDTGSTDGTLELLDALAAESGAPIKVERGEWRDDFAWARAESFAMASPEVDWLLWLDADDVLIGGENIAGILDRCLTASAVLCAYDTHDRPDGSTAFVWNTKIVRRGSGTWEGVVHELWRGPDVTRDAVIAHPAALRLRHGRREQRPGHYLPLIERAISDPVRTPRAFFLLGRELLQIDPHHAAMALEAYLHNGHDAIEGRFNGNRSTALLWLMQLYRDAGRLYDAERNAKAGKAYVNACELAARRGEAPDPEFMRWLDEGVAGWAALPREAVADPVLTRQGGNTYGDH